MQRNDDKDKGNDEGRKDGGKTEDVIDEGDDEGGTATATSDLEEAVRVMPLIVPTNTVDGGGNEQQQAQPDQHSHSQGQGDGETAASASNAPDLFQVYSDTDTRMLALLGIEPSNQNDADEQQADWRQLTGFLGIREGRRHNNNGGGDGNGTTARRTRVTTELHPDAFEHMWFERGELDLDDPLPLPLQGQPPRQQEQEEEEENGGREDEGNQQQGG